MPALGSAGDAFGKMKDIMLKLIPVIGVFIGIFTVGFIGRPITVVIRDFMINKLKFKTSTTQGTITKGDLQEYLWWIPTGLILGLIAGAAGTFVKGFSATAGNFLIGLGVGFFIGALLMPISEDIGLGFLRP